MEDNIEQSLEREEQALNVQGGQSTEGALAENQKASRELKVNSMFIFSSDRILTFFHALRPRSNNYGRKSQKSKQPDREINMRYDFLLDLKP